MRLNPTDINIKNYTRYNTSDLQFIIAAVAGYGTSWCRRYRRIDGQWVLQAWPVTHFVVKDYTGKEDSFCKQIKSRNVAQLCEIRLRPPTKFDVDPMEQLAIVSTDTPVVPARLLYGLVRNLGYLFDFGSHDWPDLLQRRVMPLISLRIEAKRQSQITDDERKRAANERLVSKLADVDYHASGYVASEHDVRRRLKDAVRTRTRGTLPVTQHEKEVMERLEVLTSAVTQFREATQAWLQHVRAEELRLRADLLSTDTDNTNNQEQE